MSRAIIQIDYEALTHIAKRFWQESEDVSQIYHAIKDEINALKSNWAGNAADTFFTEMENELLPGIQRVSHALLTSEATLNQIIKIFRQAEIETEDYYKSIEPPDKAITAIGKQSLIYLINGVNYNDNNQNSNELKQALKQKYGPNVDVITIDNPPQNVHLSSFETNLSGKNFGNWLSPVNWIKGNEATVIRKVASKGLSAVNRVNEYISSDSAGLEKAYHWLKEDMQQNGLIAQENLSMVQPTYNGTDNITENIENELRVHESSIITTNSPLSNYDYASQYAKKLTDASQSDNQIGGPVRIDALEMKHNTISSLKLPGYIASVFGIDPSFYHSDIDILNITTEGNFSPWKPTTWKDSLNTYWNSSDIIDAIGKAHII